MKPLVYKKAKRVRPRRRCGHELHITKGDTVQVISRRRQGQGGQGAPGVPQDRAGQVEGVNMVKRHQRADPDRRGRDRRRSRRRSTLEGDADRSRRAASRPGSAAGVGRGRHRGADRREVGPADPEERGNDGGQESDEGGEARQGGSRKKGGKGAAGGQARARTRRGAAAGDHTPEAAREGAPPAAGATTRRRSAAKLAKAVRARPTRTRCRGWRRSCSTSAWATRARTRSCSRPRSRSWRRSPGRRPVVTRAKKAIANFGLRAGMPVGATVTLRGARMYEFLDRFITLAIPRIRDFRGLPTRSFDGRGNYTLRASRSR